jgi:hypothetical protein
MKKVFVVCFVVVMVASSANAFMEGYGGAAQNAADRANDRYNRGYAGSSEEDAISVEVSTLTKGAYYDSRKRVNIEAPGCNEQPKHDQAVLKQTRSGYKIFFSNGTNCEVTKLQRF